MHARPHPAKYQEQQQLGRPHRNDACGGFPRRPHQSTIPRGGQSPASLALNRQVPVRGPATLAVRANGGDRPLLLLRGTASAGGAAAAAATAAGSGPNASSPCPGSSVPGGRGGRGARPTLSPSATPPGHGRILAGNKRQTERQRSSSQESFASERSLYSNPSQTSNCSMSEARQQQVRNPAKPPPPPGPPPPHILEEQRKRRELAALQRAQQQQLPTSGGGGPPYGGVEQQNLSVSRSFRDPHQQSSNSTRYRPGGDPMHLVQAGASILSNGTSSIKSISESGTDFNGARATEPTVGCGQEAAAGLSHVVTESTGGRGGVTVLTSPASGPLSSTQPGVEPESAMKGNAVPTPSSSEWQEFWDEEVEASYYYNCVTREALWVRPDGF